MSINVPNVNVPNVPQSRAKLGQRKPGGLLRCLFSAASITDTGDERHDPQVEKDREAARRGHATSFFISPRCVRQGAFRVVADPVRLLKARRRDFKTRQNGVFGRDKAA